MKTRTEITELTHEDLVNLLSTACYGNDWLQVYRDTNETMNIGFSDCESREDAWAKVLLSGKNLYFADYNAEDETDFYGERQHRWDKEACSMDYAISIENIKHGLAKAADSDNEFARESFARFKNYDDSDFDYGYAVELVQWIMFGESIYG